MATRRRKIELNRPSFDGCPDTKMTIEVGYQTCSDCQWMTFSDETGVATIDLAPEDLKALAYLLCTSYIFSNALAYARQVIEEGKAPYDVYETTKLSPSDPAEASEIWTLDGKSRRSMKELETGNSTPLDLRITKQEILAMKKVHWVEEPAAIVVYGTDPTDEWVKFYFREDDNYPDEIEISSVNNVVSLMDPSSLTWDRLAFAIWLCFSPYTDYNIIDLVMALPVHVNIEAARK